MALLNRTPNLGEEIPADLCPNTAGQSELAPRRVKLTPESAGTKDSADKARPAKQGDGTSRQTKAEQVLKKLRTVRGATIEMLMTATGWQAHSVRGFLSGTVKKKLGLRLVSETGRDGSRRYRIDGSAGGA